MTRTERGLPAAEGGVLRLLATTDLHMHLLGFDYRRDRPAAQFGLSRLASLVAQERRDPQVSACLLLDNGDSLQGTAMGDVAAQGLEGAHPMMRAAQVLGYDALGLGNHDFNYGLPFLRRVLQDAPCPVLCANMHRVSEPDLPFVPSCLLTREIGGETLRIGLFSVLPPQVMLWDAAHLEGRVRVAAIPEAAAQAVSELQAQGADVVIALCHSGVDVTQGAMTSENAAVALAAIPGIDAIVAGHTHLRLPGADHAGLEQVDAQAGRIAGRPAVMPFCEGQALGVIDLHLRREGARWHVTQSEAQLRFVAQQDGGEVPEDPALVNALAPAQERTRAYMNQPIGRTDRALHSYFEALAPDQGLALVAAAQMWAVRAFVPDDLPLLSAVAPCRTGGRGGPEAYTDIPAGPFHERHLQDLLAFPNTLALIELCGDMVRDWLEMAAIRYAQLADPGRVLPLLNAAVPGHAADVIYGLDYEIDLTRPAAFDLSGRRVAPNGRISALRHQGRRVQDTDRFAVVLNSYRAAGGGNVHALKRARALECPALSLRDVVRDAVVAGIAPMVHDPRQLRAGPGQRVDLITGPGARAYLSELAGRDVEPGEITENGMLRLSLAL